MKSRNEERRELDEIMKDWNLTFNSRVDKILDWHRRCAYGEKLFWCAHIIHQEVSKGEYQFLTNRFVPIPDEWKHCPECGAPRPEERREHE